MVTPSGGPVGLAGLWGYAGFGSGVLAGRRLQAKLLLALDLHHLAVVHGDFHRAELQAVQGVVDLAQDARFVLALKVRQGCGHSQAPWQAPTMVWGRSRPDTSQAEIFLKILFKNIYMHLWNIKGTDSQRSGLRKKE